MLIHAIPYEDPNMLLRRMPRVDNLAFLDSAIHHPVLGRYSYLAVDPFATLALPQTTPQNTLQGSAVFSDIHDFLNTFSLPAHPELPPFQGGLIGYFSYDLAFLLEPSIRTRPQKNFDYHYYQLGCFDIVMSFDHVLKKAWVISTGFPEKNSNKRMKRAQLRLNWLMQNLQSRPPADLTHAPHSKPECDTGHKAYLHSVECILDYIRRGDIFQANLARCYRAEISKQYDLMKLYQALRKTNPAPFAAFLNFSPCRILSSSPERFVKIAQDSTIETRPIKGTIHRHAETNEDNNLANKLLRSEKDRAENTMIVDLMRNDLSKICLPNSVNVSQLCGLESYQTVHHLVSVIDGKLLPTCSIPEVFAALFPGGSITGAPKIRAVEVIHELERTHRGPYCGAVGYIGFNRNVDTAITIRTFLANDQALFFHTGGGITLSSDPENEYYETQIKTAALLQAYDEAYHA